MRKFLFFAFLIISTTASAQWTIINGKQRFAKGLGLPTIDTVFTEIPNDSSQMVLRPQDSLIWWRYRGKWRTFTGGSTTTYTPTIVPYANGSGVLTGALADLKYTSNTLYIGSTGGIGTQHALDLNNGRATIYGNFNGMRLNVGSGTTGVVDPSKSFSFYNKGTRYAYITTVGSGTLGQDPPFTHKFILDSADLYIPRLASGSDLMAVIEATTGKLKTQAIPTSGLTGSGTINYIPKFTGTSAIGNSIIQDLDDGIGVIRTTKIDYGGSNGFFNLNSNSGTGVVFNLLKNNNTAWSFGNQPTNDFQLNTYNPSTGVYGGNVFTVPTNSATFGINNTTPNTSYALDVTGKTLLRDLVGTGTRMVVTTSTGELQAQAMPSGTGTVTNVATGYGLSGGPITNTGTLLVDSATLSTKYLRIVDTTGKWASATGYVPYVGATTDVDLGTHILSSQSLRVTGTNGAGDIHLKHQASNATATGQSTSLFADANGDLKYKNAGNFYTTLKTSGNAADAVYTYPSATTTLIGAGDTSVFQRKSLSAYTVMANNTAATANATAITYRDNAEAAYTGTIVWSSGTAPSGTTNHRYKWSQIGKTVTLSIMLNYTTAGTGNTGVTMNLPSDCPAPLNWNGWATSSDLISTSWGFLGSTTSGAVTGRALLANNAANNGYVIIISSSSTNARVAGFTLNYFTP